MTTTDGRAALRERHHRAILDAAAAMLAEDHSADLSANALAERAGVSRRTVFNHFPSIDAVVTQVCLDVLEGISTDLIARTAREAAHHPMREALARAILGVDLLTGLTRLSAMIGDPESSTGAPRSFALLRAFATMSARVRDELAAADTGSDPLDVDLLVAAAISGLVVLFLRFTSQPDAARTADDAEWHSLLTRLADTLRARHPHDPAA